MVEISAPKCPGDGCSSHLMTRVPGGARGNSGGPMIMNAYPFPELAECANGHSWHRWIGERDWRAGLG